MLDFSFKPHAFRLRFLTGIGGVVCFGRVEEPELLPTVLIVN